MPISFSSPDIVQRPIPLYNQIASIPPGTRLLALSGQVGRRADGSFPDSVEAQFEQALRNIVALVEAEGGTAASVARVTCFFTEPLTDLDAVGRAMRDTFPAAAPAMTAVYVAGLYAPHVKAEVEALAAV